MEQQALIDALNSSGVKVTVQSPPTAKGSVFNTAVTAANDIFSTALSPTNTPCTFTIYACFDTAGVLSVERTVGSTTVAEQLNVNGTGGPSLTANAAYAFDILVDTDETINLQYSASATALKISVVERDT